MFKKLLISFLIGTTFLFSLAPLSQAKAQATWYNQGLIDWYAKVYDSNTSPSSEIFGERYTAAQVQWVVYGLFSTILNLVPGNPDLFICVVGGQIDNCITALPNELQEILNPSASVSNSQSLASVYMQTVNGGSISGVGYVKNLSQKISPITTVKAADGVGLNAGESVLRLWKITRNISFSLLVFATIVIAFMIMFRVKINPQTVITIQSAIPKLVVSLILITFSYAIAGLVIDLMYVVIGLIATIISTGGLSGYSPPDLFEQFLTRNSGFGIMYSYWWHFLANAVLSVANSGKQWWAGILLVIFAILSILAILWWSIKIIIVMIKNFAMLMITIVLGPLQILFGTITNKSGFGGWLKQITSYVAVYPVLVIMIFFSFFFLKQGMNVPMEVAENTPFHPMKAVIGAAPSFNPPFSIGTSGGESQLIWVFISFFVFSQITKVVELVQSLFAGKPFEYGTDIGRAAGTVGQIAGTGGATIEWAAQQRQKQLLNQLNKGRITQTQYDKRSGRAASAEVFGRQTSNAGTTISKVAPH